MDNLLKDHRCASQDPSGSVGFLRLWGELLCVAQSLLTVLFDLLLISNRTIFTV